jgi:hypothetical protein
MRLAALGTCAAWSISTILRLIQPGQIVEALAVAVAVAFSLLLIAHLVALVIRTVALWESLRASAPPDLQRRWPSRRIFLGSLIGATVAALLPSGPGGGSDHLTVLFQTLLRSVDPRAAHAQVQGRTVTVNVTNGAGVPCKGIRVELRPDPPCVLHRRRGKGLRTFCTDTSFGGAPIRHQHTDKSGSAVFGAVPPGPVIVCLCKGDCHPTYSDCVFACEGPSATLTVPAAPEPVNPVNLVLPSCKCPKKGK